MLSRLADATADAPGVTRVAYGPGEQFAHDLARTMAEAIGAQARVDAAGNLYLTVAGRDPALPGIVFGSHLDSVPHGGNYDGAAGIAAGLAVLADFRERGLVPPRNVTVMAIRAEEAAWFPLSYPGSRAALGRLGPEEMQACRSDSGLTLFEHMRLCGFDPGQIERGVPQINPADIAAFVEVHIEQGPRLLSLGAPVAVVTGIAGGQRYPNMRCLGAYAHSGAEPRRSRRDSVLGFADFVRALEDEWDLLEREGREATITFGRVESDSAQHGGSRVLGELGFTLDLRSEHQSVLDHLQRRLDILQKRIGTERSVRFDPGEAFSWAPMAMDAEIIARLERAAGRLSMTVPRMPSGAGHDAAAFAGAGVATAMLFVRNRNGSHNPDEHMEAEDLDAAIRLLADFALLFDDEQH